MKPKETNPRQMRKCGRCTCGSDRLDPLTRQMQKIKLDVRRGWRIFCRKRGMDPTANTYNDDIYIGAKSGIARKMLNSNRD